MFTDIVKSTDLVSVIGDDAWEDLLTWHDLKFRSLFAAHGGEVVHHTGDGFFVVFDVAESAIRCGVAIQRALVEHRRSQGFALQVRIGVHASQATRHGNDYSGGEVHKAARIAAAAEGGEILASVDTVSRGATRLPVGEARALALKGITEPVPVVRVEWRSGETSTASASRWSFALTASSADGFSRLDRSPGSFPSTTARSVRRMIFALRVFGNSSTKTILDGLKAFPRCSATVAESSEVNRSSR
ncbi:MAG TPA: adenylate/guanylate cyclase domain-containing protein [Actinomycetota bacterium]